MSTSQKLASALNFWLDNPNDCKIDDILYKPYCVEEYRPEIIKQMFQLLTPENSYILFTAQSNQSEPELQQEPYYGTKFKTERFNSSQFVSHSDLSQLGYPEPNRFVPKQPLQPYKSDCSLLTNP